MWTPFWKGFVTEVIPRNEIETIISQSNGKQSFPVNGRNLHQIIIFNLVALTVKITRGFK